MPAELVYKTELKKKKGKLYFIDQDGDICEGPMCGIIQRNPTKYQPDLIICNGAAVCETIKSIVKPKKELNGLETSYVGSIDNYKVRVVLSGFIGRIDNYARRRLGKEIEQYLNK